MITTLNEYGIETQINVERVAKDGAEIIQVEDNYCIRLSLSSEWRRYIFSKGYIALNGASLTVSQVNKEEGWFEVWLIPETRRMTVFEEKVVGDNINVEIERGTQVVVDTVRDSLQENVRSFTSTVRKITNRARS